MPLRNSLIRLALLLSLSMWLGSIVMADPGIQTVELPQAGMTITLPSSVEGWRTVPPSGALYRAATRWSLATLEIADTGEPVQTPVAQYIEKRTQELRPQVKQLIVWEITESALGRRKLKTVKWTSQERLVSLPLRVEYWSIDYYVPMEKNYLRISYRYPDFLWRYFRPDWTMFSAGLKWAK